jgi:hypothetical protein
MIKRLAKGLADRIIPPNSNRRMLYRALRDVSRNPASFGHRINAANLANLRKFRLLEFTCPICGFKARPLYDFPDIPLRIEHRIGVIRETLQCNHCVGSMGNGPWL